MFAIEKGMMKINGEKVETFEREVNCGCAELLVTAGTNGYKGSGCRIAGGRTYLDLMCLNGDFHFIPFKDENGIFKGITIACCGDDALDAIMKALIFTGDVLTDQCCEVDD